MTTTLFDACRLGDLTLQNRIVMAPLTRARSDATRCANALMAEYYEQRASAGLIISEATVVSARGIGWIDSPGIFNDAQGESWRPVVSRVHARGAAMFLQLWHCGRASHSSFHGGALPVAPSAIRLNGDYIHTPTGKQDYETPHALTEAEIATTVADYRAAAVRAKAAGFDGVEVHSANGYLIDSFIQSRTNQREDRYGGSIDNRFRFLREVLDAVTEVFPAERVGVRFSPNGNFNDMGSPDFRETFLFGAEMLNRYGLAYLHVMDGLDFGFHGLGEPMTLSEFRQVYSGTLMGNCGYALESAAAAVASGAADLIAFGRPFISNPDLVERFRNGWALNPPAEMGVWYVPGAAGYTDFPVYAAASVG